MSDAHACRPGYRLVYCRYFRHYRTGKIVYPKHSQYFRFWVRCA